MSDAPDFVEGESEFFRGSRPDLRSRFEAACDAAGVAPIVAVGGLVVLLVAAVLAFVVTTRDADAGSAEESLPFTRPAEAISTSTTVGVPDDIVVHVAGAVTTPGVYRLAPDDRVVDAIDAAGGTAASADSSRLNLAAPLADGQQVYVVAVGEDPPDVPGPVETSATGTAGLVDLNEASASELEALPGIGPALATAIVGHRDEHGPFVAVESLVDVSGIGEAKLAGLRDFATV